MKVVICDYPDVLGRNLEYEKEILEKGLKDVEVVIYEYKDDEDEFIEVIKDADAIITAFIKINEKILNEAKKLKCISINATGYNFIDLKTANKRNIGVCPIKEYCTQDVADHTLSLILSLTRGIKHYINDIDNLRRWQYYSVGNLYRLEGKTLGILGFGKIGKAVAKRAKAFGMEVTACDSWLTQKDAYSYGVRLVEEDYLLENSDIITNHMSQNESNNRYFSIEKFRRMKRHPIFINVGRGEAVVEEDLIKALDEGLILGAGLDVLEKEKPNLKENRLTNRENVIITPHAAFYSKESIDALQRISCKNVVYYLKGEYDKVFHIVNVNEVNL